MTKKEQTKKRVLGWKMWLIVSMWGVTLAGVVGLTLLFTLARFEVLGPMPTFDIETRLVKRGVVATEV